MVENWAVTMYQERNHVGTNLYLIFNARFIFEQLSCLSFHQFLMLNNQNQYPASRSLILLF
jgi:hypothetical protein